MALAHGHLVRSGERPTTRCLLPLGGERWVVLSGRGRPFDFLLTVKGGLSIISTENAASPPGADPVGVAGEAGLALGGPLM